MISIKSGSLISKSHYTSFICLVSAYWKNEEKKRKKKNWKKKREKEKSEVRKKRRGGGKSCTLHSYIRVLMFNSIAEARNVV